MQNSLSAKYPNRVNWRCTTHGVRQSNENTDSNHNYMDESKQFTARRTTRIYTQLSNYSFTVNLIKIYGSGGKCKTNAKMIIKEQTKENKEKNKSVNEEDHYRYDKSVS